MDKRWINILEIQVELFRIMGAGRRLSPDFDDHLQWPDNRQADFKLIYPGISRKG